MNAPAAVALRGEFLTGPDLMIYWLDQRGKHEHWEMTVQVMKR